MKILIVCSGNSGKIAPFIVEQVNSIAEIYNVNFKYFAVNGKGAIGYLKHLSELRKAIDNYKPDIIHAHYGLTGLLANLQRKIPVISTYHGSDIDEKSVIYLSKIAIQLSAWNIFVSERNRIKSGVKHKFSIIPCGVNIETFQPMPKELAREKLGLSLNEKLVLFSGRFDDRIKNSGLAIQSVRHLPEVRLIELKGYSREEVALLMNAVDVCLMTSFTEGSPQFIKEAMACNCPIVSVDVGDVKYITEGIDGCFICNSYNEIEIADKLNVALRLNSRTNGRKRILENGLDLTSIAEKIFQIYTQISERTINK